MRLAFGKDDLLGLLVSLPSDRMTLSALVKVARAKWPELSAAAVDRVVRRSADDGDVEITRVPSVKGELVHLTPLGASRLHVHLSEDSSAWEPDDVVTPNRRWKRRPGDRHRGWLDPDGNPPVITYTVDYDLLDDSGRAWTEDNMSHLTPSSRLLAYDDDSLTMMPPSWYCVLGLSDIRPLPKTPCDPLDCPMHPGRLPRGREYCLWCDGSYNDPPRPPAPRAVRLPRG